MKMRLRLAIGLLAGLAACKQPDSVVLVNITIDASATPLYSLRVAMSTVQTNDTKIYPTTASANALPLQTSLVIVLPRSRTGLLDLAFDGRDAAGINVANGTTQTMIIVGGTATASVTLVAGPSACGNGIVDSGESCDDHNQFSFDGCDFRCQSEKAPVDAGVRDSSAIDAGNADRVSDAATDSSPPDVAQDAGLSPDGPVDIAMPDAPYTPDTAADANSAGTGGSIAGAGGTTGTGGIAGTGGALGPDAPPGTGGTGTGGTTGNAGGFQITWVNRTPANLPPSWPTRRGTPGLAYDSATKRSVIFAGVLGPGGGLAADTTWSWDGENGVWIGRTPSPYPATWPVPRWSQSATFDLSRNRVVVFGGWDGSNERHDLWEWDDAAGTWTDRTPTPLLPLSWPPQLGRSALAFDSRRNKVVLFGGDTPVYQTWEWDGTDGTWTNRTPSPVPVSWPNARMEHSMSFDSARGVVVLFGGSLFWGGPFVNDLWEWDGSAGTWTNRTPSPLPDNWPSARASASLCYDTREAATVLFGGSTVPCAAGGCISTGGYQNDAWLWNGTDGTWTKPIVAGSKPVPRAYHGATYDSDRSRMVLFGGIDDVGDATNDTWEMETHAGAGPQ